MFVIEKLKRILQIIDYNFRLIVDSIKVLYTRKSTHDYMDGTYLCIHYFCSTGEIYMDL